MVFVGIMHACPNNLKQRARLPLHLLALAACLALVALRPSEVLAQRKDTPSGLELPRFVSLRSDKIFVRVGPGSDFKIVFTFQRAGLPVEVYQETELWRRVRDSEGSTGWIFHTLLSGRRTALITPWEQKEASPKSAEIRVKKEANASVIAAVEPGVIANIRACDGAWCEISVGSVSGFIEQKKLWGVYPSEVVK
ncbi:MAG: SH3 domain-containing protein [Hyphomicrobiaceae bacterium]|nr:MAG: SH3 domain-containing protein [Hyphomicrobiaceae bacterium]